MKYSTAVCTFKFLKMTSVSRFQVMFNQTLRLLCATTQLLKQSIQRYHLLKKEEEQRDSEYFFVCVLTRGSGRVGRAFRCLSGLPNDPRRLLQLHCFTNAVRIVVVPIPRL